MAKKETKRGKSEGSAKTQFRKGGPSPHPAGRPKNSPNRNRIIRKVLGQLVTGDVDGRRKKVPITEASLLRLSQAALKGDLKAIQMVLMLWKESEDAIADEREAEYPFTDADRTVIEDIYARLKAIRDSNSA